MIATAAGGITASTASAFASDDEVSYVEFRFYVHESVPNNISASYYYPYQLFAEKAGSGLGHWANFAMEGTYYVQGESTYPEPSSTFGLDPYDPDPDEIDLLNMSRDFARTGNYVNIFLIHSSKAPFGKSVSHINDSNNDRAGLCYVNLGHVTQTINQNFFPEIIIHEALHCLMDDGGSSEHSHGKPDHGGSEGETSIMACAYGHDQINEWWGTQVPEKDCTGQAWEDGCVNNVEFEDPQNEITQCTALTILEHLNCRQVLHYFDYTYNSERVFPQSVSATKSPDSVNDHRLNWTPPSKDGHE